jgi:hypothetical protein
MSKLGTGEGAQAYGQGLYFAEAEDVASYAKSGSMYEVNIDVEPDELLDWDTPL